MDFVTLLTCAASVAVAGFVVCDVRWRHHGTVRGLFRRVPMSTAEMLMASYRAADRDRHRGSWAFGLLFLAALYALFS